jgi:hypothetical protein
MVLLQFQYLVHQPYVNRDMNKKSNKELNGLMDKLKEEHLSVKNEIMDKLKNLDIIESQYKEIIKELKKRHKIN